MFGKCPKSQRDAVLNVVATPIAAIALSFTIFCYRYTNLNNVVINRGKMLQTAVHSLQLFDRSMDQVNELTFDRDPNLNISLNVFHSNGFGYSFWPG